jgi:PhzF family phenazine biosynthesis protein
MVAVADVLRFAAFSNADAGGNPTAVALLDAWSTDVEMQAVAKQIGYSTTAFLVAEMRGATKRWRARFFAPEIEIAFSGSGTLAAMAALGEKYGKGHYDLMLASAEIGADVDPDGERWKASFSSPRTHTRVVSSAMANETLQLFGWTPADLAKDLPAAVANAGGNHLILALKDQARLKAMGYDLAAMKALMRTSDITTVSLIWKETDKLVHSRNAFAVGGVKEDPATGEAAAALGAYLRDRGKPAFDREGNFEFDVQQGDDMLIPGRLSVRVNRAAGSPVRVSGVVRKIVAQPAQPAGNAAGAAIAGQRADARARPVVNPQHDRPADRPAPAEDADNDADDADNAPDGAGPGDGQA